MCVCEHCVLALGGFYERVCVHVVLASLRTVCVYFIRTLFICLRLYACSYNNMNSIYCS